MTLFHFPNIPNFIFRKTKIVDFSDLNGDLCSRQVITIPFDEEEFRDGILSGHERNLYNDIDISEESIQSFDMKSSSMLACTYNCSTSFLTAKKEYLKYIKIAKPDTIKIIVCGVEHASDDIPKAIAKHIRREVTLPKVDGLLLNHQPFEIEYPVFEKAVYSSIRKDNCLYYTLHMNIPYSYYSKIPLVDSTFSYDIDTGIFYDDDCPHDPGSIYSNLIEGYKSDLGERIFPEINILVNSNNITPINVASDSTDIFMAKALKIPYIPATLMLLDGPIPFTIKRERKSSISIGETNKLCHPYFVIRE